MASRWNQHCANYIGTLSFPVGYLQSRFRYANKNVGIKYQQRYTRTKSPAHGLYNFVHTRWHRALRRPSR